LKFERTSRVGGRPYAAFEWEAKSEIVSAEGTTIFRMEGVIVPSTWSQIATDIIAQKYFRKSGVTEESAFLWRERLPPASRGPAFPFTDDGMEHDARQVFHRLAWTLLLWAGQRAFRFRGGRKCLLR
jgi:ribonucleoside-diphosphate reductase alpha chain